MVGTGAATVVVQLATVKFNKLAHIYGPAIFKLMNRILYSHMKLTTCLFLIFLFCNCKKNDRASINENTIERKGDLVMYFNEIPENWKFSRADGGYIHKGKHEVSYTLNNITHKWRPDYFKETDTLIIENIDDDIEVAHKYKGLDEFIYLFGPNDTVLFEYDGKIPVVKVLNRESEMHDFNFEALKRKLTIKDDFPSEIKYHSPMSFVEKLSEFNPTIEKKLKENHGENAIQELKSERILLDSLLKNSLISKKVYDFYHLRNFYQEKAIDIEEKNHPIDSVSTYNSGLLDYSFYRNYLKYLVSSRFEKKIPKNGFQYDYRIVYDSIDNSQLFDLQERKYLSFIYMQHIINTCSNSDIISYYKKFRERYNDSSLIGFLKDEYNLSNEISTDLKLRNLKNSATTLSKVIEENAGKVIYVDFWASWCAPCRKAMPVSIELRKEYQGRNIIFVYLALNDKDGKWRKAVKEENLDQYELNYFIDNPRTAAFIDDLSIYRIPRYLIYNKEGQLVHENAPGPDNDRIRTLLDFFIEE